MVPPPKEEHLGGVVEPEAKSMQGPGQLEDAGAVNLYQVVLPGLADCAYDRNSEFPH